MVTLTFSAGGESDSVLRTQAEGTRDVKGVEAGSGVCSWGGRTQDLAYSEVRKVSKASVVILSLGHTSESPEEL